MNMKMDLKPLLDRFKDQAIVGMCELMVHTESPNCLDNAWDLQRSLGD